MSKKNKIVAIDADHILYNIASEPAKAFTSSLGGKSLKVTDSKDDIKKLKKKFKAEVDDYVKTAEVESIPYKWGIGEVIVVISDKSNFRYDIYPEYKANRAGRPMSGQFKKLRKWARKKDAPKQNIEADDYVAYLVSKGAIGFSPDKDLVKGVEGIWFDCYRTRRHWVRTSSEDAYRFNHLQYVMGDSGDNIKGVAGVAEKTATKLLDEHGWNWNGVLEIYKSKGYCIQEAILTRQLVSMNQWSPKKGLKLFKG